MFHLQTFSAYLESSECAESLTLSVKARIEGLSIHWGGGGASTSRVNHSPLTNRSISFFKAKIDVPQSWSYIRFFRHLNISFKEALTENKYISLFEHLTMCFEII